MSLANVTLSEPNTSHSITLSQVSASYGSHKVLEDLNLTIPFGRNLSIIGPNGSGKSTLLKVLDGLLPYEGSVTISAIENKVEGTAAKNSDDSKKSNALFTSELKDMKRKDLSSLIASMPQFSQIYFSYTVWDTVLLGRYVHHNSRFGLESKADKEYAEKCLELCDLKELRKRSLDTLSGGQLQRVLMARTLAQETPVILLDEPTNHLDLKYQSEMMQYLIDWSKGETMGMKNTLIAVLHDISLASEIGGDVLLLNQGRAVMSGDESTVLSSENLQKTYGFDVVKYLKERLDIYNKLS